MDQQADGRADRGALIIWSRWHPLGPKNIHDKIAMTEEDDYFKYEETFVFEIYTYITLFLRDKFNCYELLFYGVLSRMEELFLCLPTYNLLDRNMKRFEVRNIIPPTSTLTSCIFLLFTQERARFFCRGTHVSDWRQFFPSENVQLMYDPV